jgi:class 3 adenylate cyclase
MQFRIGVNLGDVLVEGDDILGDGVNVAARLEGAAEPGGIYISDAARRRHRRRWSPPTTVGGAHREDPRRGAPAGFPRRTARSRTAIANSGTSL